MNYMSEPPGQRLAIKPHNLKAQIFSATRWMAASCSNMMAGLGYDMLTEEDFALFTVLDNGHITLEDLAARLSWPIDDTKDRVK